MADISKTADQALAVLTQLGESGPMTATEVSRAMNLNRSVAARLLTTLHRRGYVVRASSGAYAPGAMLVRMASSVLPELRAAAIDAMRGLARRTGETVVLEVPDGHEVVVLEQVVGTAHVVRVEHDIGTRHRLDRGSTGRSILAFLDEETRARIAQRSEDPAATLEQIETVRQSGYAISHDELQNGTSGLAMPVRVDRQAIASLGVLVPTRRAPTILEHLPDLEASTGMIAGTLSEMIDAERGARIRPTADGASRPRRGTRAA